MYKYGMKFRGFSIGCQPMNGFIERLDDTTGKYYDVLVYGRELTDKELADYELEMMQDGMCVVKWYKDASDKSTYIGSEIVTKSYDDTVRWATETCDGYEFTVTEVQM